MGLLVCTSWVLKQMDLRKHRRNDPYITAASDRQCCNGYQLLTTDMHTFQIDNCSDDCSFLVTSPQPMQGLG